jgi:hypothetical protein
MSGLLVGDRRQEWLLVYDLVEFVALTSSTEPASTD